MAAWNPYNVSLFTGAIVLSYALDATWLAVCASALEIVWLLYAPDSAWLRRLWLDPTWEAQRKADAAARLAARATSLGFADQKRARFLGEQRTRIGDLARENPSFATAMLVAELDKLDGLTCEFVDLGVAVAQRERHLGTFDAPALRRAWDGYQAQCQVFRVGDLRHEVAAQNLEVLKRRWDRHEDLVRSVQAARGQMDLIESSVRLLADEVVTMAAPGELGQRLDELRIAVDAIRGAEAEAHEEGEVPVEATDDPRRAGL
jgi:hypothetical protein